MGFRSFSWAEASAAVITFAMETGCCLIGLDSLAAALLPAIGRLATAVAEEVAEAIARALGCLDFSFG